MSFEDILWDDLRLKRNHALAACDWRALKDVVLSTAWKEYRSALRDLPSDNATTDECFENWPTPPE
jgi:hypothetical protein